VTDGVFLASVKGNSMSSMRYSSRIVEGSKHPSEPPHNNKQTRDLNLTNTNTFVVT